MNPELRAVAVANDWVKAAQSFQKSPSEGFRRAAVSRIYYALFLKAWVALTHHELRSEPRIHITIGNAYRDRFHKHDESGKLRILAKLRSRADYDLRHEFSESMYLESLRLAYEIHQQLALLLSEYEH